MPGTLYVVGAPVGDHEDLTLRARRLLEEVRRIVAEDVEGTRSMLADLGMATAPVGHAQDASGEDLLRDDAVLVVYGWPGEAGCRLVSEAAEAGHNVVAVPGPALPITSLILSGLPADAFLYLGELSAEASDRHRRLTSASGEPHTLLALASPPLGEALSALHEALGNRPLALIPASSSTSGAIWRGSLERALGEEVAWHQAECYALVLGGAPQEQERWNEERLAAEIEARLAQGQRAKEISQQLAEISGWSRRNVYGQILELGRGRD